MYGINATCIILYCIYCSFCNCYSFFILYLYFCSYHTSFKTQCCVEFFVWVSQYNSSGITARFMYISEEPKIKTLDIHVYLLHTYCIHHLEERPLVVMSFQVQCYQIPAALCSCLYHGQLPCYLANISISNYLLLCFNLAASTKMFY